MPANPPRSTAVRSLGSLRASASGTALAPHRSAADGDGWFGHSSVT